jgi:fibronectin type 3 domain-containing protein
VPNAPANLNGVDWGTYIQLDWQDMSADETGFHLYRRVDNGAYGLYQTFGANVTTYQDHSVIIGKQYRYYVKAYNAVGESAASNEVFLLFGA